MKNTQTNKIFAALSSAAMALPGVSSQLANAAAIEPGYSLSVRSSQYKEDALPVENLNPNVDAPAVGYQIDVQQVMFRAALDDTKELTISALSEEMSGASPWFISQVDGENVVTMSSATGGLLAENRDDIGISFRSVGDDSQWSVGVTNSKERDYESIGGNVGYTHYFNNNNQSFNIGLSYSEDTINATDADRFPERPQDEEDKSSISLSFGGSRNVSSSLVVGASYTYGHYKGFLSNPYKLVSVGDELLADLRPNLREQHAFNIKVRKYLLNVNAALHADYRYFTNSWGVNSYTVGLDWYQNLGADWQIIPSLRYYIQGKARFFSNVFEQVPDSGHYSSDHRLSAFDAISYKLKVSKKFDKKAIHLTYERYDTKDTNQRNISPALIKYGHISAGFDINF